MKTAIIVDSASGLSKIEAESLGLYYLPLQILVDDKTYLDGVNISVEEIFNMIADGKMPKTSMPTMGSIEKLVNELKNEYDNAILVSITSGLSSTMSTILSVAAINEFDIREVDCFTTCSVQKEVALNALELVKQGLDIEECINKLNESLKVSDTFIIPNDLDHLCRGGRLTPLAAKLGGLLKIKPILKLNKDTSGKIDAYKKVRTMSKAIDLVIEELKGMDINDDDTIHICHTGENDNLQYLIKRMNEEFKNEIDIDYIYPVVSVHTGLGCLGVQFVRKVS